MIALNNVRLRNLDVDVLVDVDMLALARACEDILRALRAVASVAAEAFRSHAAGLARLREIDLDAIATAAIPPRAHTIEASRAAIEARVLLARRYPPRPPRPEFLRGHAAKASIHRRGSR